MFYFSILYHFCWHDIHIEKTDYVRNSSTVTFLATFKSFKKIYWKNFFVQLKNKMLLMNTGSCKTEPVLIALKMCLKHFSTISIQELLSSIVLNLHKVD